MEIEINLTCFEHVHLRRREDALLLFNLLFYAQTFSRSFICTLSSLHFTFFPILFVLGIYLKFLHFDTFYKCQTFLSLLSNFREPVLAFHCKFSQSALAS